MRSCQTCGTRLEVPEDPCPHCGAAPSAWAVDEAQAGADAAADREMTLLATLSTMDAASLLEHLEAHGIAAVALHDHEARALLARSGAAPTRSGLHIFVPPEALAGAAAIHQALVVGSLPDLPEGYDPGGHDASACPACGTPLDPAAHVCGECGLEFPEADR